MTEKKQKQAALVVIREGPNGTHLNPYDAPSDMQMLASFLRDKGVLRLRDGIFHGKRLEYFKGKRMVDAIMSEAYQQQKMRMKVDDRSHAETLARSLMEQHNFFFRVQPSKDPNSTTTTTNNSTINSTAAAKLTSIMNVKTLEMSQKQFFEQDGHYVWQWTSPRQQMMQYLISVGLVIGVLALVLFPLWPMSVRTGVWYLSMGGVGLIGLLFIIAIVRLFLFLITMLLPPTRPGLWLFPNLFADVGVVDSFIPLWGWHGIDYERQHIEKYKRQALGSTTSSKKTKKKKTKSSTPNSNTTSTQQQQQQQPPPPPLLEETGHDGMKHSTEDEEITEELIMDK